jgi:murein DD-endopeptidase MepM/ murein hydrolase activator NlpD
MAIEGSQLPAETRVNQLMARIETMAGTNAAELLNDQNASPQDFRTVAAMMENQMLSEAFVNPDDKDSSNPISNMFGMGNPQMMGQMNDPMMMLSGGMQQQMMGMYNPMMMQGTMMNNPLSAMQNLYGANQESMVMPVQGRISSEYGDRSHPVTGHNHFHSGVDIAAPMGSAIRAPWEGKVVYVGPVSGFGPNTVIVAHENNPQEGGKILYSVFGHNQQVFVNTGDHVSQGDIFATVGSEGRSTGPHVHWETRVAEPGLDGTAVFNNHVSMTINPMSFA